MSASPLPRETEEEGMNTAHEGQGRSFLADSLFFDRRNCRGVPICYAARTMMKLYWFLWIVLIAGAAVLITCAAMDDFAGLSK
jgi:hypothetical protein